MKRRFKLLAIVLALVQIISLISACAGKGVTVSVDKTNIILSVDEVEQVTATSSTEDKISWRSSDEAVAIVSDDGMVKAIAPGNATLTAFVVLNEKEYTATTTVTVRNYYDYSSLSNEIKGYVSDNVVSIDIPDNGIEDFNYTTTVKKDGTVLENIINGSQFNTEEPGSYEITYHVTGNSTSATEFKRTVSISSVNPYYVVRTFISNAGIEATQANDVKMENKTPQGAIKGEQSVRLNNKSNEDYFRVVYMKENFVPLIADLGNTDTIGFRMFIEVEEGSPANTSIGVQSAIFREHDKVDHKLTTPRVPVNVWTYVGFNVAELKATLGTRPEAYLGMYLQKSGDIRVKSVYIYSLEVAFGGISMFVDESAKIGIPSFDISNFDYTVTLSKLDGTKVADYTKSQKEISPDVGEYVLEYKVSGDYIKETTISRTFIVQSVREYGDITKLKYFGEVSTNIPVNEITDQNIPANAPAVDSYYHIDATSATFNPRVVLSNVNIRDFIDDLDEDGVLSITMYQKLELKEGKTATNYRTWSDFDLFYGSDLRISGAKQDIWVPGNQWFELEIPVSFVRQYMGTYPTIYLGFYLSHSNDFAITDIYLYDLQYKSPSVININETNTIDLSLANPGYGDLSYDLKVTSFDNTVILPDNENSTIYTIANWGEYKVEYTNIQGYKVFSDKIQKTLQVSKTPAYGELLKFMYNNTAVSGIDENFSTLNPSSVVGIESAPAEGPAKPGESYFMTKRVEGYTVDNIRLVFTGNNFVNTIQDLNVDSGFIVLKLYAKMEAKQGTTPTEFKTNSQFKLFRNGNQAYGQNSSNIELKGNQWVELQIPVSFIKEQMTANSSETNAFLGLYAAPNGSGDVVITEIYLYDLFYRQGGIIKKDKSVDLSLNDFDYTNLTYDITITDKDNSSFIWTGDQTNTTTTLSEFKAYQVEYSNIKAEEIIESGFIAEILPSEVNITRSYDDQIDVTKTTELINWQGENTVERKIVNLDDELRYALYSQNKANSGYYCVYLNPVLESELNNKRILPTDKFVIRFMLEGSKAEYTVTPRVFFTVSSLSNANLSTSMKVKPNEWVEIEVSVQDMLNKSVSGGVSKTPKYLGLLLNDAEGIYIASYKVVRGDITAKANTSTSVGFPVGNRDKSNYTVVVKNTLGETVFTGKEGASNFIIANGLPSGEYTVTYEANATGVATYITTCKLIVTE